MGQHEMKVGPVQWNNAWDAILAEVHRAESKFPQWPDDPIHGCMIMAEESGEAVRACLQLEYEGGSVEAYRKELVQTAAMCIRALADLDQIEQAGGRDDAIKACAEVDL